MFARALIFFVLAMSVATSPVSASRGITVTYKENQSANAPVAGEMQLYSNSYALVIGIDDYRNGWPRLSNAVNDASKVAAALRKQGFDVTMLTDLDGRQLETAFEDFFIDKGVDPQARLFVWYAGHGHTVGGEGYLIPADGVPEADERNFKRRSLSLRRFSDFIRLANSKHVYTIFDSCFAGTIFNVARSSAPPAITRVTAEPVRQFLTSGDAGQQVSDDGTFANLFVEALEGRRPADLNRDGFMTAEELGSYMTSEVSNYTYNSQVPRHGKLRDPKYNQGDFVFQLGASTLPPPPAPVSQTASRQVAPVAITAPKFNAEDEFWSLIKDSTRSAEVESYLSEYPNGKYAVLARLKLARLKESDREQILERAGISDVELRLFESAYDPAEHSARNYTTTFVKADTRRVWVEVFVNNTNRNSVHSHDVVWRWFKPNGEEFGKVEGTFTIQADWETSWIERGWGWETAGNYQTGNWRVEVSIDGAVYEKSFRIR